MKLLYCRSCKDCLKLLHQRVRFCSCGNSSGRYLVDGHDAETWGRYAEVIGVGDVPLLHALKSPDLDSPMFSLGPDLKAWIYPKGYEHITRHISKVEGSTT